MRAVSIAIVVFCHVALSQGFPRTEFLSRVAQRGSFGVEVFFVLSGYLITWLLLSEEDAKGRFGLRAFYLRRVFRILPPAFFYLACISVLAWAGRLQLKAWDILPCIFFFRNLTDGAAETTHFWSLAIEEQFYFLWPFFLFLVNARRKRLITVAALLLFAPVWRQLNYVLAGGAMHVNSFRFDVRYDALLMGCGLALLRHDPHWMQRLRSGWPQSKLTPALAIASLICLLAGVIGAVGVLRPLRPLVPTLSFAAVALLINYSVERTSGAWAATLNHPAMRWLGALSYSLYIWQQLFVFEYGPHASLLRTFPINLLGAVGAAAFSFYLIEKPFVSLKSRIRSR